MAWWFAPVIIASNLIKAAGKEFAKSDTGQKLGDAIEKGFEIRAKERQEEEYEKIMKEQNVDRAKAVVIAIEQENRKERNDKVFKWIVVVVCITVIVYLVL